MSARILPFTNTPRGKTFARKGLPADVVPTVVILPCIRYERWGDEETESGEAGRQAASTHH